MSGTPVSLPRSPSPITHANAANANAGSTTPAPPSKGRTTTTAGFASYLASDAAKQDAAERENERTKRDPSATANLAPPLLSNVVAPSIAHPLSLAVADSPADVGSESAATNPAGSPEVAFGAPGAAPTAAAAPLVLGAPLPSGIAPDPSMDDAAALVAEPSGKPLPLDGGKTGAGDSGKPASSSASATRPGGEAAPAPLSDSLATASAGVIPSKVAPPAPPAATPVATAAPVPSGAHGASTPASPAAAPAPVAAAASSPQAPAAIATTPAAVPSARAQAATSSLSARTPVRGGAARENGPAATGTTPATHALKARAGASSSDSSDGSPSQTPHDDTTADVASLAAAVAPATSGTPGAVKPLAVVIEPSATHLDPPADGQLAGARLRDALASVANHAVLRGGATGEIDVPELGRVLVHARSVNGAVDVEVAADRADTRAALHLHAGAMTADLRDADVRVSRLTIDGPHGAARSLDGASSDGSSGASARRQNDSSAGDSAQESDDASATDSKESARPAGRVRIVL